MASGDRIPFNSPRRARRSSIRRGAENSAHRTEEVRRRYGVDPNQVPDFIALRGDPSDKLPGAAEVGQSAPLSWCNCTARLMAFLRRVSFQLRLKMLRLFRLIATMDVSAPLLSLTDQEPTWASASSLARTWGLNQWDRLDGWHDPGVADVPNEQFQSFLSAPERHDYDWINKNNCRETETRGFRAERWRIR